MDGYDMLEKMNLIDSDIIEQASGDYYGSKIHYGYWVGAAASFVLLAASGIISYLGSKAVSIRGSVTDEVATVMSQSSNWSNIIFGLSAVAFALFIFLLIRDRKNGR